MVLAEPIQLLPPFGTQPGLERSLRVVDARVDHTGVVRARVQPHLRMTLDYAGRPTAGGDGAGGSKPNHPATDDRHFNMLHVRVSRLAASVPRASERHTLMARH